MGFSIIQKWVLFFASSQLNVGKLSLSLFHTDHELFRFLWKSFSIHLFPFSFLAYSAIAISVRYFYKLLNAGIVGNSEFFRIFSDLNIWRYLSGDEEFELQVNFERKVKMYCDDDLILLDDVGNENFEVRLIFQVKILRIACIAETLKFRNFQIDFFVLPYYNSRTRNRQLFLCPWIACLDRLSQMWLLKFQVFLF